MKRLRDLGVVRWRAGRRGADVLLWLAVTGPVFLVEVDAGELPELAAVPLPWMKAAAVPLLGLAVAVARRHPVAAAAVPPALGTVAMAEPFSNHFMVAQLLLSFLLGRRTATMRAGLAFFGVVCLASLALVWLDPGRTLSSWIAMVAGALLMIMLPWLAGRYARQHDELVRTGWELAERLEREQDLIGERTRLVERSRIAGDMHDSLGHELSLVALRAAALQVSPGLDDSARKAAGELRESAARATAGLREIIGVLREGGGPAPVLPPGDTVAALVGRAAAAGMAVTLEGEPVPLPPMADRAAYRVVQEALTNVTNHAPGAAVIVRLGVDSEAGEAVVTVTNAPPPAGLPSGTGSTSGTEPPSGAAGEAAGRARTRTGAGAGVGGHGLIGLDERVRLAGGRLRAGPLDGGFEVVARLPLTTGAAATPPDARRELALARRKVRRSVIDAIWVPVAVAGVLLSVSFGFERYVARQSVLDARVYADLRVGQSLPTVEPRLPTYGARDRERPRGAPADPPGTDECRFYRTRAGALSPAYRLCFTAGRLSHKDVVRMARTSS